MTTMIIDCLMDGSSADENCKVRLRFRLSFLCME